MAFFLYHHNIQKAVQNSVSEDTERCSYPNAIQGWPSNLKAGTDGLNFGGALDLSLRESESAGKLPILSFLSSLVILGQSLLPRKFESCLVVILLLVKNLLEIFSKGALGPDVPDSVVSPSSFPRASKETCSLRGSGCRPTPYSFRWLSDKMINP